jgi:hypothetical protein
MEIGDKDWLIGHPCEDPGYAFTDNLWQAEERRAIALAPWNATDLYNNRLMQVKGQVARIFAICGPGWESKLPIGFQRLDLAINQAHYPRLRTKFNPPGKRKFLYIGCTLPEKGTDMLAQIAHELKHIHFGHIGPGLIPGTHPWGYVECESPRGQKIVSEYDAVISCGKADANPTTMLEALSWGLVPLCTYESGWSGGWLHRFPYGDIEEACRLIDTINESDHLKIDRTPLDSYTWQRFYSAIRDVLGGNERGHPNQESPG